MPIGLAGAQLAGQPVTRARQAIAVLAWVPFTGGRYHQVRAWAGHADRGGRMDHRFGALEEVGDGRGIAHVADHHLHARGVDAHRAEHPIGLGRVAHEEAGLMAVGEQVRHGVRPDEPGCSGDGHPHGMIMA